MSTITSPSTTLTMRLAGPADDPGLGRIAELDSTIVPGGPLLLALVDGELHAALAIESGIVVADPFRPTAHLVTLLRDRASALDGAVPVHPRATLVSRLLAVGRSRLRPVV